MAAPQDAFLEMLVAALKDAAAERKLSQLQIQLDPTETGKGPLKIVRVIIVPEEMDHNWPSYAPLGTGHG
jgi:hypothetical protein